MFVLLLGALLLGCGGSQSEGTGDAPEVDVRPVEETSNFERPSRTDAVQEAVDGIDEASIRESLAYLTGAAPVPLAGGPTVIADRGGVEGRRAAAEYMREAFEAVGIPARILEFDYGDTRGFNVEATLEGTGGGKHLWVTAHLDSFYNAGANDDGSGLVSVLMTARALEQLSPRHTVHFVAYDLEEVGLVGSTVYTGSVVSEVREREGDRAIIGNLHSDMIGYDDGGRFEAFMGTCGDRAGAIDEAMVRASEIIDSPVALEEDCLGRSDHENFWEAGLPAAVVTDSTKYDGYPWYHEPGDTTDKLNIAYMRSVIQLTATAAGLLSEEP